LPEGIKKREEERRERGKRRENVSGKRYESVVKKYDNVCPRGICFREIDFTFYLF
jgi:hypothetical protein